MEEAEAALEEARSLPPPAIEAAAAAPAVEATDLAMAAAAAVHLRARAVGPDLCAVKSNLCSGLVELHVRAPQLSMQGDQPPPGTRQCSNASDAVDVVPVEHTSGISCLRSVQRVTYLLHCDGKAGAFTGMSTGVFALRKQLLVPLSEVQMEDLEAAAKGSFIPEAAPQCLGVPV